MADQAEGGRVSRAGSFRALAVQHPSVLTGSVSRNTAEERVRAAEEDNSQPVLAVQGEAAAVRRPSTPLTCGTPRCRTRQPR